MQPFYTIHINGCFYITQVNGKVVHAFRHPSGLFVLYVSPPHVCIIRKYSSIFKHIPFIFKKKIKKYSKDMFNMFGT
jgi:hypothetical protein